MLALFLVHHALNGKWTRNLFRGKVTPLRALQTALAALALVTMLGTVIPPLVILSVISLFYDAFRSNLIVSRVMKGMQAGVAAVIFDVVLTMAGQIIGRKRAIPIVTLAGAFIASWFFDVHILLILLACALIGLAQWRSDTKKGAAA